MGNLEAEVQAWGRRLDERKSRLRWSAGRIAGEWESSAARKMEEAQEALFRKLERLWWKQEELKRRIEPLKMDALPRPIDDSWTQRELFAALEKASHLPKNPDGSRPIWSFTHGLRVFGWTHAYGLPYALRVLAQP